MSKVQTAARSIGIAKTIAAGLGLDIGDLAGIISKAIELIVNCQAPADGGEAQSALDDEYQVETRRFNNFARRTTARTVRQSARQNRTWVTFSQSFAIGDAILEDAKSGDLHQLSIIINEN